MMSKQKTQILKRALAMLFDALILIASLYLAKLMRGSVIREYTPQAEARVLMYGPIFVALHLIALNLTGVYRIKWKYADLKDMFRLFGACFIASALSLGLNALFTLMFSRAALVFMGAFSFVLLVASRYVFLLIQNLMFADKTEKHVRRALIVGADEQGIQLHRALPQLDDGARHESVAFLDDDVDKIYRKISGLPVDGNSWDIEKVIKRKHVDEVLFTSPLKRGEAMSFIYLNAVAEGCAVSRYEAGALKPLRMEEVLDGGFNGQDANGLLFKNNIAIIGSGELARELALICAQSGAGQVFALDSDPVRLGEMARAGAWVKLGSTTGEKTVREFLRRARPDYVFYMATAGQQELVAGNEQALVLRNVISPLWALRYVSTRRACAFVYLSEICDEPGAMSLFQSGEEALLSAEGLSSDVSVAAVSVTGLMHGGGSLERMRTRAQTGQRLSTREGEEAAFISCRSAAFALMNIAQTQSQGRFTVMGELKVDLSLVARALTRQCASRLEPAVEPAGETEKESELEPTGLKYVYRRKGAPCFLPPCVTASSPSCPESEDCAKMLKG